MRGPENKFYKQSGSYSETEDLGLQSAAWTLSLAQSFVFVVQSKQTCRKTQGTSTTFAPRRLCLHPSSCAARDTTSKPEANSADRAERSSSSTAKPRTTAKRLLQKESTLKSSKRGISTAQLRKDGTCTQSIANVSSPKDEHEQNCVVKNHIAAAPTQNRFKIPPRKRLFARVFGVPGESPTSTNRDVQQTSNGAQKTLEPLS